MPTFSRKVLRQTLGLSYLRDTLVGTTALVVGAGGTVIVLDPIQANPLFSGDNLYQRATVRVASGDYYVASYNTGSGAFVTLQTNPNGILSGADYELHQKLSAADKDRALDDTIRRIRVRQEVGLMVFTDNMAFFAIDTAASPHAIQDVLDVYYFASPFGSLTRSLQRLDDFRIVTTATGRELRISPTLQGSQQIVMDAILELTMGSGDAATLNLPDDRWVLAGAAAQAYHLMIQSAPGQNAGELAKRRAEWAGEFTRLSGRFAPAYASKIRLNDPVE